MRGSGKADVFVMLAHPVGHAKSPGMFNELFEQKGLDSLMVPLSCKPEDFDAFWVGLTAAENVRGVIVSVPSTRESAARISGVMTIDFADRSKTPPPALISDRS